MIARNLLFGSQVAIITFLIFVCYHSYSQDRFFTNINIVGPPDGLTETTNYFCYKDSKGLLWISSLSGMYVLTEYLPHVSNLRHGVQISMGIFQRIKNPTFGFLRQRLFTAIIGLKIQLVTIGFLVHHRQDISPSYWMVIRNFGLEQEIQFLYWI